MVWESWPDPFDPAPTKNPVYAGFFVGGRNFC